MTASLSPLRIVFMGTPQFAVPCLRALMSHPELASVLAVYTQPDRPSGRGQTVTQSAIKAEALKYGLPVFQPENINKDDEPRKLADHMADIVIVVAYAQFLGRAVLNTPRLGCMNVHSSLLPKFRGAAPIQYSIWKGESVTGVTTMKLVSKMDAGPLLLQDSLPITDTMTTSELHDRLSDMGATLLIETLRQLRNGKLVEHEQDESLVSFAPVITKDMGLLDFTQAGEAVVRQIRAFTPWPGTFAPTNRGTLKIHRAAFRGRLPGAPADTIPGSVFTGAGGFYVKCGDGWLELLTVQLEGKKAVSAAEFLNGLQQKEFKFANEKDALS